MEEEEDTEEGEEDSEDEEEEEMCLPGMDGKEEVSVAKTDLINIFTPYEEASYHCHFGD